MIDLQEGVMKQYKTNPNILPTQEDDEHASASMPKSAQTSESQFMGKRN